MVFCITSCQYTWRIQEEQANSLKHTKLTQEETENQKSSKRITVTKSVVQRHPAVETEYPHDFPDEFF